MISWCMEPLDSQDNLLSSMSTGKDSLLKTEESLEMIKVPLLNKI